MHDKLERLTRALAPIEPLRGPHRRALAVRPTLDETELGAVVDLKRFWRTLRARRWSVAAATSVGLLAAAAWNFVHPPIYRAAATIQIDREQPSWARVGDDEPVRLPEQPDLIETQYKILKSRTLARGVIAELNLAESKELNHGIPPGERTAYPGRLHPRILERYLNRLRVTPAKGTRLVEVSYDSIDPQLAPQVVNALGEAFVEHNLQSRWDAAQRAGAWLENQLAALALKLQASEAVLNDFSARHSIVFVQERGDVATEKLARLEEELTRAEADRVSKQALAMLTEPALATGPTEGLDLPPSLASESYRRLEGDRDELLRERSRLRVAFAPGYPSVRRVERELAEVRKALDGERARILAAVREEYEVALTRQQLLAEALSAQRKLVHGLSGDYSRYDLLKRDAQSNRDLYEGLLARVKQAGIAAGLRASNIAILDPAEVPERPYRPRKALNCIVGLSSGLLLGVALALLREHVDEAVRTPEEVEQLTGLTLLAVVPRGLGAAERKLITEPRDERTRNWAPEAGLAEAYRTFRSSVLIGWEDSMRGILLTSAHPQEGKTTLSLNLACSLAQLGRKVLLVDADLRRPDCHRQLGLQPSVGLSDYLQGEVETEEILYPTSIDGLTLAPAGKSTAVASDLLYSARLAALLEAAAQRFDHIVIDSPPSLALSDARTMARLVDAVVLVVSDKTERGALVRTKRNFDDVGVGFTGFVMNRIRLDDPHYGAYRDYGLSDRDSHAAA